MIGDTIMSARLACWCGNAALVAFCPGYLRCPACDTLVSSETPASGTAGADAERCDFHGRHDWSPDGGGHRGLLSARTRSDLTGRCLRGLRALLAYVPPPARVLELGSGHGGFVGVLRLAGFEAMGIEMSPRVVEFARAILAVPILLGPLEAQDLEPGSFDAIALMGVLEHLSDPTRTMRRSLELLKPDGILLIQTPCYPACAAQDPCSPGDGELRGIPEPRAHRHVFSPRSLRDFFHRLGAHHLALEPDRSHPSEMFAVVSRRPLHRPGPAEPERVLTAGPGAWIAQALLDAAHRLDVERQHRADVEADRAGRLRVIEEQGQRLHALEAERDELRAEVLAARPHLAALQEQVHTLLAQLRRVQALVQIVVRTRAYRVLRALGRWTFIERALDDSPARDRGR
jgi:SAM-dependent methyltransferase